MWQYQGWLMTLLQDHLVANHLETEDLIDIALYARHTGACYNDNLVVWTEVFPTSRCHQQMEPLVPGYIPPTDARWFLVLVSLVGRCCHWGMSFMCTHTCMHVHTHACMSTHMYECPRTCMHVHTIWVCMHICPNTCACVQTWMHVFGVRHAHTCHAYTCMLLVYATCIHLCMYIIYVHKCINQPMCAYKHAFFTYARTQIGVMSNRY